MSTGRHVCGLDLGNYNSKICIFHNKEPVAVSLKQGSFSIPTLIVYRDGVKHYGYQASLISGSSKDNVAFEFFYFMQIKSHLDFRKKDSHSIIPSWSPIRTGEKVLYNIGHNYYLDLDVAIVKYVKYLLDCASSYLSYGQIDVVAVSVPIYLNGEVKARLPSLFDQLSVPYSLFWEPAVGVLAHIYKQQHVKDYVLFCSYGSSSFDVSLVSTNQKVEIVQKDGNHLVDYQFYGGKYNTKLICRHIKEVYGTYNLKDDSTLQSVAEQIKLAFYEDDEYYFDLQEIANDAASCSLFLERQELRKILSKPTPFLLNEMSDILNERSASDTEIVICGKEARSPIFKELVRAHFENYEVAWYDCEDAFCAYGACLAQAHCDNGINQLLAYKIDPFVRSEHGG